jgi:hypothetical protein
LDLDTHQAGRKRAKVVVATSAVVAMAILWYAATRNTEAAGLVVAPLLVVLATAWRHKRWILQALAQQRLPHAAMEQQVYALLAQHTDLWLTGKAHNGGAPCVAQWRWKRDGLWLEQCSVIAPNPGQQNARRRLPIGRGQALVAHRVAPFALGNAAFAKVDTTHRALLILEWTTAHSRLALLHAIAQKTRPEQANGHTTRPAAGAGAGDQGAGTAP